MKFDDILKEVGDFGPFQRRVYIISLILNFTLAWPAMITVFINAPVDHWCATPEWDAECATYGLSTDACKLAQKQGSIPSNYSLDGELEYAQCGKYNVSGVEFWPGMDSSNYSSETISCENGWVYDDSQYESTTVTDFDLVCGKDDLTQVSQSIFYRGFLAGSLVCGILSDRIGRWWTLLIPNVISLLSGIAIVFSPTWWFFATMRFFMGFGNMAFNLSLFVIGTEYIGPSKRYLVILIAISYALGYMLLALPAYFIRSWRLLTLITTLPLPFVFILLIWLPESARWLIASGKYDKAEKVIRKVAEVNQAELPSPLFTDECIEEQEEVRKTHKPTGLDLIRTPRLRMRTINLVFIWMVNAMVYHGLSLNSSNLGGNDYLAFTITAAIEIPAYLMVIVFIQGFGRKPSLFLCLMAGGLACLSTAFIPPGSALTTVAMIGKFGISGSFSIIYLYTTELYPTQIRGVAIGTCSMFGRVASISAPLILLLSKYWDPLPIVIYGSLSVMAALVALALPETRRKQLPETLEEGERFGLYIKDEEGLKEIHYQMKPNESKEGDIIYENGLHYGDMSSQIVHENPAFNLED